MARLTSRLSKLEPVSLRTPISTSGTFLTLLAGGPGKRRPNFRLFIDLSRVKCLRADSEQKGRRRTEVKRYPCLEHIATVAKSTNALRCEGKERADGNPVR